MFLCEICGHHLGVLKEREVEERKKFHQGEEDCGVYFIYVLSFGSHDCITLLLFFILYRTC